MALDLVEIMHQALREEIGVKVRTNDVDRLRQKFYALRREFPGAFDNLVFVVSAYDPQNELWIGKKSDEGEELSETHAEPDAGGL